MISYRLRQTLASPQYVPNFLYTVLYTWHAASGHKHLCADEENRNLPRQSRFQSDRMRTSLISLVTFLLCASSWATSNAVPSYTARICGECDDSEKNPVMANPKRLCSDSDSRSFNSPCHARLCAKYVSSDILCDMIFTVYIYSILVFGM